MLIRTICRAILPGAGRLTVLLALASMPAVGVAQSTVTDGSSSRPLANNGFFGVNGQTRAEVAYEQGGATYVNNSLKYLYLGVFRFPGGTGANYWDWGVGANSTQSFSAGGDFITDYYGNSVGSTYKSPLSEMQAELTASTSAHGLYVMNVLTDPKCVLSAYGCDLPHMGPNQSYQMLALSTAQANGLTIPYVELGNEFWGDVTCNNHVYPDSASNPPTSYAGYVYANALASGSWAATTRTTDSDVKKIAIVANFYDPARSTGDRGTNWNRGLFAASPFNYVNAVVLHIYQQSHIEDLVSNGVVSNVYADNPFGGPSYADGPAIFATMLAAPFHTWDKVTSQHLNGQDNSATYPQALQIGTVKPDVWVTEYNLRDINYATYGSWAHGLYLATMSLKFLESPRVTMALHHEALGSPVFGDIISSTDGFGSAGPTEGGATVTAAYADTATTTGLCSTGGGGGVTSLGVAPRNGVALSTTQWALSAAGVTAGEIDHAALGQTGAKQLVFSNTVPVTDPSVTATTYTYASLYGWHFTGATHEQLVVLNLGSSSQAIDISAVGGVTTGTTYRKISGFPGAYVRGGQLDGTGGYSSITAAYVARNGGAAVDSNLTVSEGTLSTSGSLSSFTLPAYSITRLTLP